VAEVKSNFGTCPQTAILEPLIAKAKLLEIGRNLAILHRFSRPKDMNFGKS
jgi:hypothetical protein